MLVLLRIIITGALIYVFREMKATGAGTTYAGDLTQAFYMAIVLILAILMAMVWAPFLGERIADPLTGELTAGSHGDHRRLFPQLIRWFERRGWRRATLICCIFEGLDNPDYPTAFVTGLRQTRPGTWWEKVFAKEVFRFDNVHNCLEAATILEERHGIELEEHERPDVTMALKERRRSVQPPAPPKPIPKAPALPKRKRNERIRIFVERPPTRNPEVDKSTDQQEKNLESTKPVR